MHIIIMLFGMLLGLSAGTNFSWFVGVPVMIVSLFALNIGTPAWRERHEGFFLFSGLCCGVFVCIFN